MTLPNPAAGDTVQATDVSGIKNHLEGASGSTAPYHLRQSTGNMLVTLPDNAGATKFRINDSDAAEVFSVDSNGTITNAGSYAPASFTFPTSASPAPTTDGQALWDSDDNNLAVGNGTATQVFFSDDKGSDIASASTLTIGNGHFFHVTGTTTITALSTKPAGLEVILYFASVLTLTHNSTSLILREAKSRNTASGEIVRFISEGSGNWREASTGITFPKVTTSDQVYTSDNTLNDISPLSYEVVAGGVYRGEFFAVYAAHVTPDLKVGFTFPAGEVTYLNQFGTSTVTQAVGNTTASGSSFTAAGAGVGVKGIAMLNFVYDCDTSGTFQMQGSQATSDANEARIYSGATFQLTRVV